MKIIGIIDKHSGPAYHRVLLPYHSINGIDALFTNYIKEDQVKDIDALIVPRFSVYNHLKDFLAWREKYGFKLIVDVDDYWHLDPTHIGYENWKRNGVTKLFIDYISNADLVTCTHERLYEKIRLINDHVEILPNAIPYADQFAITKTKSDKLRLFWAGSITHKHDMCLLKYPLQKVYSDKKLRDKIFMVLAGYMKDHKEWDKIASAYTNSLRIKGMIWEGKSPMEYYEPYKFCDVGLIPLCDTSFNTYKSNLKILECANVAAPCIVSEVNPYLNMPHVLYVNNQSDWYKHIKYFSENENYRVEMGEYLRDYCRATFNFESINKKRLHLLEYETGKSAVLRIA